MNKIIKNYNLLVKNYQKIEKDSTEQEIHDKRVTLRRIFPILAVYKINPSNVKNGEKAFKLFGKLRDIQVQILKLESTEPTPETIEYLAFLKELELELQIKVQKFCKKKKLVFPSIKKKSKIDKAKIFKKVDKSFNKLVERMELQSIDDAEDVHKIRIEFKKFRYVIEILSYIEHIDEAKLERLKHYQDKLGEIQDYEVLIKGITKFYKKRKNGEELNIETFERDQNQLIENFDNELEMFVEVCRDVISQNNDVLDEELSVPVDQPVLNNDTDSSVEESVIENKDAAIINVDEKTSEEEVK